MVAWLLMGLVRAHGRHSSYRRHRLFPAPEEQGVGTVLDNNNTMIRLMAWMIVVAVQRAESGS